eukprot:Gb_06628 [translate_table: standard]
MLVPSLNVVNWKLVAILHLSLKSTGIVVKVQALSFSADGKYLASVGGQDDAKIVIWNVETGQAVCGSPMPVEHAEAVKFFNTRQDKLVTAGGYKLLVWDFDALNHQLRPEECLFGKLRRVMQTLVRDFYFHLLPYSYEMSMFLY